MEDTKGDRIMK